MKCTPDTPHDRVAASLALCEGCGRPVVILRQHGGNLDGTALVSTLSDEGLVGLATAAVLVATGLGLAGELQEALRNPGSTLRFDDRRDS